MTTKQETSITKRDTGGALATNIFEADANQGAQNITQDDLALPFLKVLGQLSPEVNTRNAKYVSTAQPGMILNTVSNELYNGAKGINVLPGKDNAGHFLPEWAMEYGENLVSQFITQNDKQMQKNTNRNLL